MPLSIERPSHYVSNSEQSRLLRRKIVVVGAGNGGCLTALHLAWYSPDDVEIELIYNPDIPPESVGQATTLAIPGLLGDATGFTWHNNLLHATPKSGILYEGWGKASSEIFHPFPPDRMAMHYCPWEMQKRILNSGWFKVIEDDVDPKDVDAEYVFDCRGKPEDYSDYYELINPINSCILGRPKWNTTEALWSRHVATPDGWTFIIPTHSSSPSHDYCVGYSYNSNISTKEAAESNFLEMFDVEVTQHVTFKNYMAHNPIVDGRIFLNGNKLFFLDPLESTSGHAYLQWARFAVDVIAGVTDSLQATYSMQRYVQQIQNFVLWHYQGGSQYDTPFWDYARGFSIDDDEFYEMRDYVEDNKLSDLILRKEIAPDLKPSYALWGPTNFKYWSDGIKG